MSLNVVDNSNYGFTEGIAKAEVNRNVFTGAVLNNANNCIDAGCYFCFSGMAASNLPAENSSGLLIVTFTAFDDDDVTRDRNQFFFDTTNNKISWRKRTFDGYMSGQPTYIWSSWVDFGA